ncbi:MAG: 3-dehydroquinate synthase [Limnochordia bacterium]|jgi:3-dehydroquinate synthase|nr:3-dehydroquinate synthase [Limnochordia bacterium]
MEMLQINLQARSYPIYIGQGLITDLPAHLSPRDSWVLISDEIVDSLYGQRLVERWGGPSIHRIILPVGERAKTLQEVERIVGEMLALGVTRSSGILALGGGVVGDVAGFCASIYMRGIPYVQVPTTLLAQVDSSIGGKTGVNMPQAKNIMGSFYQPQAVFMDTDSLHTLPRRHLISGLAEVIKYGVIYDYGFLSYLHDHFAAILNLEEATISKVITRCCEIKAEIVAEDEKDEGIRRILNHGHTIGHALEAATEFQQYTHGEAVLIGMQIEALMARELGLLDQGYCGEILTLIERTGMGFKLEDSLLGCLLDHMTKDKKNRGGKVSFVLPSKKGETTEVFLTRQEAGALLERL